MRSRGRRAGAVGVACALLALLVGGAGCGRCNVSCGPPTEEGAVTVLTATVLDVDTDNGLVRVVSAEGNEREFRGFGRIEVLDRGSSYLFPVSEGTVAVPDPCDCGGPYITHLDGEIVETGYLAGWRDVDIVRVGLTIVGLGVVLIAGWAALRHRRGLPL